MEVWSQSRGRWRLQRIQSQRGACAVVILIDVAADAAGAVPIAAATSGGAAVPDAVPDAAGSDVVDVVPRCC